MVKHYEGRKEKESYSHYDKIDSILKSRVKPVKRKVNNGKAWSGEYYEVTTKTDTVLQYPPDKLQR